MRMIPCLILLLASAMALISIDALGQEECPNQNLPSADRRPDPNSLTIIRQFSFPDPVKIHNMLQYDPASGMDRQAWETQLQEYLSTNFSQKADIIMSDDMTSCEDLILLKDLLNDQNYRAYQVPISKAKRKLGVLSKLDLKSFTLEIKISFEEEIGPECGSMFQFETSVHKIPLLIAGAYLRTNVDSDVSCAGAYAFLGDVSHTFQSVAKDVLANIIFFGDMNVYDGSEPLNGRKDYETLLPDWMDGPEKGIVYFKHLPETTSLASESVTFQVQGKRNLGEVLAPIIVTQSVFPAVKLTDRKTSVEDFTDSSGKTYSVGKVKSAYLKINTSKINEGPLSLLFIGLILAVVVTILGFLLFRLNRRRNQQHN